MARAPWLIDHGGTLYAHHDWASVDETRTRTPFPLVKDHVLLDRAGDVAAADAGLAEALDDAAIARALDLVPDELLTDPVGCREFSTAAAARARYRRLPRRPACAPRASSRRRPIAPRDRLRREPARRLSARR